MQRKIYQKKKNKKLQAPQEQIRGPHNKTHKRLQLCRCAHNLPDSNVKFKLIRKAKTGSILLEFKKKNMSTKSFLTE